MFIWWRNNISFSIKKGYWWKDCLIGSERLDIDYCQVQDWKKIVYVSITKHPFEGDEISVTKTIALPWKWKANFISATQYHKVHVFSPCWMLVLKVSRRNTNFFWSFKLPLCGLVRNVRFLRNICGVFKKYIYLLMNTHVFTYRRRQEFQNILERKLCSCFGQLLLIY